MVSCSSGDSVVMLIAEFNSLAEDLKTRAIDVLKLGKRPTQDREWLEIASDMEKLRRNA